MAVAPGDKPTPGFGIIITNDELIQLRKAIQDPSTLQGKFWRQFIGAYNPAKSHYTHAAFVYLVTGDAESRDAALKAVGTIPPWKDAKAWSHFGGENLLPMFNTDQPRYWLAWLDFVWSGMGEAQRKENVENMAGALRFNWRFGILCEGHSMLHPRLHANQAFTYVGSWLMTAGALRKQIPDGDRMFNSIVQTYVWMANILGDPDGGDMVRENAGYFDCGMCGWLGGSEAALRAGGIDLYGHPFMRHMARRQALYVGVARPYKPDGSRVDVASGDDLETDMVWGNQTGVMGKAPSMRFALPAQRIGEPDAAYWWWRLGMKADGNPAGGFQGAHLGVLGPVLGVAWTGIAPIPKVEAPKAPPFAISRLLGYTKFRTGNGVGDLLCMIGSDYFFMDAYDEMLICGQGGGWHMQTYNQAIGRSTVLVEDQRAPLARPVEEAFVAQGIEMINTRRVKDLAEGFLAAHGTDIGGWEVYKQRDRMVVFARPDYFVVVDEVAMDDPSDQRRMQQQWLYNILGKQNVTVDEQAGLIRLDRPLASIDTHVLYPAKAALSTRPMDVQGLGSGYQSYDGITAVRIGLPASGKADIKPVTVAWNQFTPKAVKDKTFDQPPQPSADPGEAKDNVATVKQIQDSWDAQLWTGDIPVLAGETHSLNFAFRKKDMALQQESVVNASNPGQVWYVEVRYMGADGKDVGGQTVPVPGATTATCDWTPVQASLDVPRDAKAMRIGMRFWHQLKGRKLTDVPLGQVWLKPFVVGPCQEPAVARTNQGQFFNVIVPRKAGEAPEKVATTQAQGATQAVVEFRGNTDMWIYNRDKAMAALPNASTDAKLALVRTTAGGAAGVSLMYGTRLLAPGPQVKVEADKPILLTLMPQADGTLAGKLRTQGPTTVSFAIGGNSGTLKTDKAGYFVVSGKGQAFALAPSENLLELDHTSPDQSATYAKGLKPLTDVLLADRDATDGLKNYALGAKATASASHDERFGPEHVIDNEVAEYGRDGRVDFRLGSLEIMPHQGGWYGKRNQMPVRVLPTYWLLPDGQTGSVTLELPQPQAISRIRLLNTQNQGANDRATIAYRVAVETADGKTVEVAKGQFGEPMGAELFGLPAYPKGKAKDGSEWGNTWASDTPVPLYLGFKSIDLSNAPMVKKVTVFVDSFWGRGGGLNEIQLLGK